MSAFFDTNVLYYLTQTLSDKRPVARRVVLAGGVISPQVLNEFADATRRKLRLSWDEIMEWREMILLTCEVVPMTGQSQAKALEIAQNHQLHIYDANIWAAAILAGCETLYSEDMHDGLTIEGTTLRNPFGG